MTKEVKQIFSLILFVIVFIFGTGFYVKNLNKSKDETIKSVKIGDTKVLVTLADSDEKRKQGLAGTTHLDDNQGMLFIFNEKPFKASFWMKDMLIPIDIIWIKDNKVSQINDSLPPPSKEIPDTSLQIFTTSDPIDYVLEVNAGFSRKNNITVGTKVELMTK